MTSYTALLGTPRQTARTARPTGATASNFPLHETTFAAEEISLATLVNTETKNNIP